MRSFACPQGPRGESLLATIAVTHGAVVVEQLIERHRDAIAERSQALREAVDAGLAGWLDYETAWDRSFGRALQALGDDEVDPVDALVDVALRLVVQGQPARWAATLREPQRRCWGNQWLLPAAREIVVHSDGTIAAVLLVTPRGDEAEILLRRDDQGWRADHAERLIQIGTRRPITLLTADAVPADLVTEDEFPPITPDLAQPFADALGVLEHRAPEYMGWVDRVLRGVLVCRCGESLPRSTSWVHAPGVVLMSASDNPIELAEMMVHESSRQYCHVASRLGATVDGGDAQHDDSPVAQLEHPLSHILIEYHALGNALLFYRTLLWNQLSDPYCIVREAQLSSDADILAAVLHDSPVLTALGRDLFEPLHERLGASQ